MLFRAEMLFLGQSVSLKQTGASTIWKREDGYLELTSSEKMQKS
jgi:hypothetical protein